MEDLYLVMGETDKAAELDKALVQQKTKDPIVVVNRCRILIANGKLDEAIATLQKESKDAPDSAHVHYFLEVANWKKRNIEQAKSELEEASRIAADMLAASNSLAELYLEQGDFTAATQYGEPSIPLRPADSSIRMLLGAVYERQGQFDLDPEPVGHAQKLAPAEHAADW